MNGWQTIETAPRDGTAILVFNDDGRIYQAEWDGRWRFAAADQHGCGCCSGIDDRPTHWMPLPEPPKDEVR